MHQAHTPQAPPTRCTAHTRDQRPDGTRAITPAPPTQPGPKGGGGRRGSERQDDNWWTWNKTTRHHNVRTTVPAPQTEPQPRQQPSVPRAWTSRSIARKTQTTVTYRGATPTTTTAPAIEAEVEHQTQTPPAPPTRCTAHIGKNPDPPTQRPNGTPTTAPGRPTQPGPTGRGQPESREHSDGRTRNRSTPHQNAPTTAAEPQTAPEAPHRVGVPRVKTARSKAPKKRTTAKNLNTRRSTTKTGTLYWGQNDKPRRRRRGQRSHAQQRTTHTKHHYRCQVEHPAPRRKPTPKYLPLPKPLTRP